MENNIVKTLEKLMSFKTVKGNVAEFKKLYSYIKSIIPNNLFIKEYDFNGDLALVISNVDETNFDIIFSTHVDVVPCNEYSFNIIDNKIYGRGSIDMKGSVAVLLELFKNVESNKKIALFITSDEEQTGYSTEQLVSVYDTKLAVVPDGGKNFEIIEEEKGLLQLKLSINTNSAHAAKPYDGVNAINELYKIYSEMIKLYPLPISDDDYKTSINLSILNGGDAVNKVPNYAEMILDIRHIMNDKKEVIINNIKNINSNVYIEIIGSGSIFKTDISNKLIKEYINICEEVIGEKIKIVSCASTSDAIYFSDKNIPTVLTNPTGGNPHANDEYVTIDGLNKLYKIFKKMIEKEE